MKKIFTQLIACLCLLLGGFTGLSAQIELNTQTFAGENADEIVVMVTTKNFEEIAGMQFTVNWDPTILEFQSIGQFNLSDLAEVNFNTGFAASGEMPVAWLSLSNSFETVADGSSLFGITFKKLSEVPAAITFDNTPTKIEFVKYPDQILSLVSTVNEITIAGRALEGQVLFDSNDNCAIDDAEKGLRDWTIDIEGPSQQFKRTDESGKFIAYLPFGTYQITAVPPPGNLFSICEPAQTISILEGATEAVQTAFAGQATVSCPSMTVELGVSILERCPSAEIALLNWNNYIVAYCNFGTTPAENAYVELTLDPDLTLIESEIPYTEIATGVYRFELGTVDFSFCGSFALQVAVNCETSTLGQTHCSSVKIFPNTICEPPSENWSKASLQLKSECLEENSKIQFHIENVGQGDMQLEQQFIVIEDMIMLRTQNESESTFKLKSGESKTLEYAANGATFRLETDQVPNHPIEVPLAVAIEGCGTNDAGEYSKGIITKFEQADESQFEDIDCHVNVGLIDNNRLLAFPNGYQTENYIEPNTAITYQIRFQNDGTETASKVVILNPLSELLDVSTIVPLVSSHPYQLEFEGPNILKFTFENLDQAFVGEHFVKFKVTQQKDVSIGSVIENIASVYIGNNEPLHTNNYFHTVGQEYIEVRVITAVEDLSPIPLKISPNPFFESATIQVDNAGQKESIFRLYDLNGRNVKEYKFSGNTFQLERGDLSEGMYLFEVHGDMELLGSGKLVISENSRY